MLFLEFINNLGGSPPAGGSGFPFQTFFAEKAQKGFPLQSLTFTLWKH